MPATLLYRIEASDLDSVDDLRARMDAFRESVNPSAEYGLLITEATAEDIDNNVSDRR